MAEKQHGLSTHEPPPTPNNRPACWDLVQKDIAERDDYGRNKYGVRLQPFNGRDYAVDCYQEALDLVVYLRGLIYERSQLIQISRDDAERIHEILRDSTMDAQDLCDRLKGALSR